MRKINLKFLLNSRLISSGFLLTASGVLAAGLGYGYQILLGRLLAPNEFALLTASVSLAIFSGSLFGALGMLIARRVAALKTKYLNGLPSTYFWRVHAYILLGSICLLGATNLLMPYAQEMLRTHSTYLIWLVFIYVVMAMFYSVNYAVFQGLQKFYSMGVFSVASVILKVILSISLIYLGYGVIGAFSGMVLGLIVMVLLGFMVLKRNLSSTKSLEEDVLPKIDLGQFSAVYLSGIVIAALTQLDTVLVNWYFPGDIAGEYAAISVLGKGVLYLPGGLVLAMFPMVAENHAKAVDSKKMLIQGIALTVILSLFVVAIFMLAGKPLLAVLYGNRYSDAAELLPLYGLAMVPLALVIIAEHYLIAKGKVLFAWLFFALAPLELLALHYFHSDLRSVIFIIGAFSSALAVLGFFFMSTTLRDKK